MFFLSPTRTTSLSYSCHFACIAAIYRNFHRFSLIYLVFVFRKPASDFLTHTQAAHTPSVCAIKIIRKLFQWLSKRNSLNEYALQAFSHFLRANTLCSDLRMLLLTQSLPSRFHSHFPLQLLIKAHCNTHKITKYNHYKRIIHLKLLDSFIDHVLLCWSHTHTLHSIKFGEHQGARTCKTLAVAASCQSIAIYQMGYFTRFVLFVDRHLAPSHVHCHRLDGIIVVTL